MSKAKTFFRVVIALAALALLLFGSFWVFLTIIPKMSYHAGLRGKAFDSTIWKAEAGKSGLHRSPRRPMIRDLTKQHLLIGMTRADVVDILGEPRGYKGDSIMDYWLGSPGGFTLDHDLLEIFLDDAGNVTHWRVRNT